MVSVKDSLAVPWTAPQDYVFDADAPGSGLEFTDGKTLTVLCDGSAQLLVEKNDWLNLFGMNDGKVVSPK